MAREFGLSDGVIVAAGGGDNATSAIGIGATIGQAVGAVAGAVIDRMIARYGQAAGLILASLRLPDRVATPATRDAPPSKGFPVVLPATGPAGSVAGE